MLRQRLLFFSIFFCCAKFSSAQITFDTTYAPQQLVDKFLLGQGVRSGNVTFKGPKDGIGFFQTDSSVLGIESGIILSTGSIYNANGPNNSPFTTSRHPELNDKKRPKGDRDLNKLCKSITYDASVLEFDFIPYDNKIYFSYVFGSEEYPEYVGTRFNDVFGFFIDGDKLHHLNLATIPRTVLPVSINTINDKDNNGFYIDNDYFKKVELKKTEPGQKKKKVKRENKYNEEYEINKKKLKKMNQSLISTTQYDGMTVVMTTTCYVVPYKKYHMKIAIGDVGDAQYDSGVFLEEGSFNSERDENQPKFKDYPDLHNKINIDSLFGVKPVVTKKQEDSIAQEQTDYERFEITNINFNTDQFVIPDTSKSELTALAKYLKTHNNFKCALYGFTDNRGSKKYNQRLSENRANAVMSYLIGKGVDATRINISGYNFEKPIADNSSERGRALNRRVEIQLVEE